MGVDANMSVIVAMGNSGEWLTSKKYIGEGQKVIVRLMNSNQLDTNITHFQSHIQK